MQLHGYFRSSAAYRVRIALNLKGLCARQTSHHLRKGEQRAPDYLAINPQGLVPALVTDEGEVLTQSLAIIEWLDEIHPQPPLLPADPVLRAQTRAFALAIACEIHPIQNPKILARLRTLGHAEAEVQSWAAWIIDDGFKACEKLLRGQHGPYCFGESPTIADICLVPQLANARRFKVDIQAFPRLLEAEAACQELEAFRNAAPERQPDAE